MQNDPILFRGVKCSEEFQVIQTLHLIVICFIRTYVQDGCTPLHLAVENGNTEMVKIITAAAGVNFTIKNEVSRATIELHCSAKFISFCSLFFF